MIQTAPLQPAVAWELASSKSDPLGHGYRPELREQGWNWLADQIADAYAFGFRTMLLHRPFGEPDQDATIMDVDARVESMDDPLVRDYPAFQDKLLATFPNLHLIPYIGSLRDESMTSRVKAGRLAAWIDRARRSYLPFLDADRVHIGLDHASSYPPRLTAMGLVPAAASPAQEAPP